MSLSLPFEDLREGDRFTTGGRTVTEADVVAFAAQTGDFHPQHVDAEWSASSAFGERVAHGMLVLSYAVGLIPFDPERVLALRRVSDAVFKRPVRIGDTIHVEGRVGALVEMTDTAGLATLELRVLNQEGRTVCRGRLEALWRRENMVRKTSERCSPERRSGSAPSDEDVERCSSDPEPPYSSVLL